MKSSLVITLFLFEKLAQSGQGTVGVFDHFQHLEFECLVRFVSMGVHCFELLRFEMTDKLMHRFTPRNSDQGEVEHHMVLQKSNGDLTVFVSSSLHCWALKSDDGPADIDHAVVPGARCHLHRDLRRFRHSRQSLNPIHID